MKKQSEQLRHTLARSGICKSPIASTNIAYLVTLKCENRRASIQLFGDYCEVGGGMT